MRFVLFDAYRETHPDLTRQMKTLHQTIPALFSNMLKGREGISGVADDTEKLPDDTDTDPYRPLSDDKHSNVDVLGRLKTNTINDLKLPIKKLQIEMSFRRGMLFAYEIAYGRQVTIMGTSQVLKWWKRVSWDDKVQTKRIVKRRGQYIVYKDKDSIKRYNRLDHVFIHNAVQGRNQFRVFLIISPAEVMTEDDGNARIDLLTGLTIYRLRQFIILGLPQICAPIQYMIPFQEGNKGNWTCVSGSTDCNPDGTVQLLRVDWDVRFM
ncbi:hypothetical protein GGS21DRAFT_490605 [Xylaria nigripes]|nr:hypothetical protein GGS21DRAFT_490605 [Xylaria nigripes]